MPDSANEETGGEFDYSIPGFAVRKIDPPAPWALVVKCAGKTDWGALSTRVDDKYGKMSEIPTTVMYRENAYRIEKVEASENGWTYRMAPWPENERWINIVELSPEAIEKAQTEKREIERAERLTERSLAYDFLLGWLPASAQERLSERWHFGPEDASRRNAFVEMLIGFLLSAFSIIFLFSGFYSGIAGSLAPLVISCGILFEGYVRWGHVLTSEQPLGLCVLEAFDWLRRKRAEKRAE